MKKKYFFKNQSSLKRQIIAGSLAAVFVAGTVGGGIVEAMKNDYDSNGNEILFNEDNEYFEENKESGYCSKNKKKIIIFVMLVLVIAIVVVLVLMLRTNNTKKETTNLDDEKEKNKDEQRKDGWQKEQKVEPSPNKILDGAKIVGNTLVGSGVGLATTALVEASSKGGGTTIADSEKKAKSTGEDSVVEAVALQGGDVADVIQNDDKAVETKNEEKVEPQNANEDTKLGVDNIEKIEGKNKEVDGDDSNLVVGNVGLQASGNIGDAEGGNVDMEETVNEADHKLADVEPDGRR